MQHTKYMKFAKPEVSLNMCQSEAWAGFYLYFDIWIAPWKFVLSSDWVAGRAVSFRLASIWRSCRGRFSWKDAKAKMQNLWLLLVSNMETWLFPRNTHVFSNDRSLCCFRGSSLGVSMGTVQFKCQHAKAVSIPNHRAERREIAAWFAFQLWGEISLINSSLFELHTVSLFGSAFVKLYHKRTETQGGCSSEREIYSAYFIYSNSRRRKLYRFSLHLSGFQAFKKSSRSFSY